MRTMPQDRPRRLRTQNTTRRRHSGPFQASPSKPETQHTLPITRTCARMHTQLYAHIPARHCPCLCVWQAGSPAGAGAIGAADSTDAGKRGRAHASQPGPLLTPTAHSQRRFVPSKEEKL